MMKNSFTLSFLLVSTIAFMSGCTKTINNYIPGSQNQSNTPPVGKQQGGTDSSNAQGGVINGGGGRGVRCVQNGKQSVQTLDLHEAKALYSLQTLDLGSDEDAAESKISLLVAKHFWNPMTVAVDQVADSIKTKTVRSFLNKIRFIQPGQHLKLTDDAHAPILETGCEDVQIATYYEESILLVDNELWSQLDWTNKMALVFHELFYFRARQMGSSNSMATRKFVGMLFSTQGLRTMNDGLPPDIDAFSQCSLNQNGIYKGSVYLHEMPDEYGKTGIELIFNELGERGIFFRTTSFLRDTDFLQLLFPKAHRTIEGTLETDTYSSPDRVLTEFNGTVNKTLTGKLLIESIDSVSKSIRYDLSCDIPRDLSKLYTHTFPPPGEYHGENGSRTYEVLKIAADGTGFLQEAAQFGTSDPKSNEVPYPTNCRVLYKGEFQQAENGDYILIATSVQLGDLSDLHQIEHCSDFVKFEQASLDEGELRKSVRLSEFIKTK